MDSGIHGKTALVTGASKGIGRAIAHLLAEEGARLCIVARNEDALEAAASDIRSDTGAEVMAIAGDVTDPHLAERVSAAVSERWGSLHIVVNNAGGPPPGSFLDHSPAAWSNALDQSFLSVVRMATAVVPAMKEQGWGRIINITSTIGKEPTPGMVLSASARAAVSAFSKAVAAEVAPHGITINTIAPGGVRTERSESLIRGAAEKQGRSFEDALSDSEAMIPAGRLASPAEIATIAVFLASENASYITGTTVAVDGGLTRSVY